MRFQNWPERLAGFIKKPHVFDWVGCNCVLFIADAVAVLTGVDHAESYRHIKTKRGMLTKMQRDYGGDVERAAIDKFGEPININMAKRGDVVLASFEDVNALGICLGTMSIFTSEHDGLVHIRTGQCKKAWAI